MYLFILLNAKVYSWMQILSLIYIPSKCFAIIIDIVGYAMDSNDGVDVDGEL